MTKQEFIDRLSAGLACLTESDAQERITFYREMIEDRIEEGLEEEAAVAQIGNVDEIVASILAEIPKQQQPLITKVEKPKQTPQNDKKTPEKRLSGWQILLLCVGAPLWVPLLVAALAVLLSLLAALWSVVVSCWSIFASLAGVGIGCTFGGVVYGLFSSAAGGIATFGAGLVSTGLAILAFHGCVATTKGCAWLTKTVCVSIVKFFFGRGRTE